MNSIVSDKNNKFYYCVKDKKVEQNDLDKVHTFENSMPTNQSKGENFKIYIFLIQTNHINK